MGLAERREADQVGLVGGEPRGRVRWLDLAAPATILGNDGEFVRDPEASGLERGEHNHEVVVGLRDGRVGEHLVARPGGLKVGNRHQRRVATRRRQLVERVSEVRRVVHRGPDAHERRHRRHRAVGVERKVDVPAEGRSERVDPMGPAGAEEETLVPVAPVVRVHREERRHDAEPLHPVELGLGGHLAVLDAEPVIHLRVLMEHGFVRVEDRLDRGIAVAVGRELEAESMRVPEAIDESLSLSTLSPWRPGWSKYESQSAAVWPWIDPSAMCLRGPGAAGRRQSPSGT